MEAINGADDKQENDLKSSSSSDEQPEDGMKMKEGAIGNDDNSAAGETEGCNDDGGDIEDWKHQAEEFKESGNAAFKAGRWEEAIDWYTKAIELDPEDRVYFSNRSAAYLKMGGAKSKALKDAQRCMALAPDWSKSHSRLGAAQHALGRFEAAIDTYREGLKLEPENVTLQQGIKAALDGQEVEKKARWKQAKLDRAAEQKREEEEKKAKEEQAKRKAEEERLKKKKKKEDEDPLASFFSEVVEESNGVKGEGAEQHEKYTKQELGTPKDQINRLLSQNYKWKNLNPYIVLQLDIDATAEDIKQRYRKLSTMVHPDKQLDEPLARDAFEEVKKAYLQLTDPKRKDVVVAVIEAVRGRIRKERNRLIDKGMSAQQVIAQHGAEEVAMARAIMKEFADQEMRKREVEKHKQAQQKREREQEDKEKDTVKKTMEHEKAWREEERRDKRVGNWRDFSKGKKAKGAAAPPQMWKEEERQDDGKPKFGKGDQKEYRKAWK